jgi:pilus assembly protein CpaF
VLSAKPIDQSTQQAYYEELKAKVHQRVIELLDLTVASSMGEEQLGQELSHVVEQVLQEGKVALNQRERGQMVQDILDEVSGLGPLEPLLKDHTINDILVNSHKQIYIERYGKLERTAIRFRDEAHLRRIIERIVARMGRRVDETSPMVDTRLPDGSRVNAIIPPCALDGACLSIRKFSKDPLQVSDLIEKRSLTPEIAELLRGIVRARLNVLISGGTGCGKTTLLNILSGFIPTTERIVTIEDAAELQLRQDHVVRLETRPANIEGKGEITQRDLVRNALRMRPDRIVVGEVRGAETLDMLQAMNTGHDGSLTTVHANSARDALARIEMMVAMAGLDIPSKGLRYYISSALDVIVQLARLSDGSRRVVSVQELSGMEGEVVTMQEVFTFEQTGIDQNGKVKGRFRATGIRPKFAEKFQAMGIQIPNELFDAAKVYEC